MTIIIDKPVTSVYDQAKVQACIDKANAGQFPMRIVPGTNVWAYPLEYMSGPVMQVVFFLQSLPNVWGRDVRYQTIDDYIHVVTPFIVGPDVWTKICDMTSGTKL